MGDELSLEISDGPVEATVEVPGSKSIANRALVCAALADGVSTLRRVATGDDTAAMIGCLGALGIDISVSDSTCAVHGVGHGVGRGVVGGAVLDARLAGTTSRFITAVAALSSTPSTVTGDEPLRRRPMSPLHDALTTLGASIVPSGEPGHLPVTVSGGELGGGVVRMRGDVSSQYVTALMLIAPLMRDGITIELTTPLVSRPYVAITASVMSSFGVSGIAVADNIISVEPGEYRSVDYDIEPDASSASYPLAVAAITGGKVTVPGLGADALQGDAAFADVLAAMGCRVERGGGRVTVSGRATMGIDVDMADMSDLVPTLAAIAPFASSPTRITGVGFIRNKESDRIGDLVRGLRAIGVDAVEDEDGLSILPSADRLTGATLPTHHDHRLAMAWSLLALRVPGIVVQDPSVVTKSWPEWWTVRSSILTRSKG